MVRVGLEKRGDVWKNYSNDVDALRVGGLVGTQVSGTNESYVRFGSWVAS